MAEKYTSIVFLEVFGDETIETRRMMMEMQVRVTPTFKFFKDGQLVETITGSNENKLTEGILACLSEKTEAEPKMES